MASPGAGSPNGAPSGAAGPGAGLPPIPPEWATEDRGPQLIAIFWVEASIALLFICARLYARLSIKSLGLDDIMMSISMIAFLVLSGIITSIATLGGFRHLPFVPPENASTILLLNLIAQSFTVFAYGTSKFSIGYLILRLLPPNAKKRKIFIWVLISATLFYNWLQIILTFIQCHPYEAAWNPLLLPVSTCWTTDQKRANIYIGGAYNVLIDFILAVFPSTLIWHLQLNTKKKISLAILLGLGLLAAICGSIKLKYVDSLFSLDATWVTYDLDVWSGSELFVVIVCGSAPPCKPLWDRLFPGARLTTKGSDALASSSRKDPSGNGWSRDYEMIGHRNDVEHYPMGGKQGNITARTDITVENKCSCR